MQKQVVYPHNYYLAVTPCLSDNPIIYVFFYGHESDHLKFLKQRTWACGARVLVRKAISTMEKH
jgi:hypothetical protein